MNKINTIKKKCENNIHINPILIGVGHKYIVGILVVQVLTLIALTLLWLEAIMY